MAFQDTSNYFSYPRDNQTKQSPLAPSQYRVVDKSNELLASAEYRQYNFVGADNSSNAKSSQSFVDRSYLKNIVSKNQVPTDLSMAETQRSITENANKASQPNNQMQRAEQHPTEVYSPNIAPGEFPQLQP